MDINMQVRFCLKVGLKSCAWVIFGVTFNLVGANLKFSYQCQTSCTFVNSQILFLIEISKSDDDSTGRRVMSKGRQYLVHDKFI